jgi:hypothetical protein
MRRSAGLGLSKPAAFKMVVGSFWWLPVRIYEQKNRADNHFHGGSPPAEAAAAAFTPAKSRIHGVVNTGTPG